MHLDPGIGFEFGVRSYNQLLWLLNAYLCSDRKVKLRTRVMDFAASYMLSVVEVESFVVRGKILHHGLIARDNWGAFVSSD